jgi:hypothetical protein
MPLYNNIAGGLPVYPTNPFRSSRLQDLEAIHRKQQETVARQLEEERNKLALRAQQLALHEAYKLAASPQSLRSTTGTDIQLSNADRALRSLTSQPRTLPPQIEGRFMSLINFPDIDQLTGSNLPERASLKAADFSPADARRLEEAEFGYQKGRAGQMARSAIDSLREELAGRGILGSGTEFRGTAERIASSIDPLAQLIVGQLGRQYEAVRRERELAEQRAAAAYQGEITQRAQDIQAQQAIQALKATLALERYKAEEARRLNDLNIALQY